MHSINRFCFLIYSLFKQHEVSKYNDILSKAHDLSHSTVDANKDWLDSPWESGFFNKENEMKLPYTGIDRATMDHMGAVLSQGKEGFNVHKCMWISIYYVDSRIG